jgi:hypothetical protein
LRCYATQIDVHSIGIGAGNVERLCAAGFAEFVFSYAGIECVSGEVIFTTGEAKIAQRHNQMQKTGHIADRTIAVLDFNFVRCFHFKFYRAAMAATLVDHLIASYFLFPVLRILTFEHSREMDMCDLWEQTNRAIIDMTNGNSVGFG